MKTRRTFRIVGILSCSVLLSVLAERARAQEVITIVGPPNGTRITDCETSQLVGSGYIGAIYWGPGTVTDPNAFVQVGATMNIINGQLAGGTRIVTTPVPGSPVNLFGTAWEATFGATYEQASRVFGAKVGRSDIVSAIPGGAPVRIPDFQVCPVPEASTWALLGLGLLTVAVRHSLSRRQ